MSTREYDEARAGRRPCSAGFTLIETVIALFIITLMVLVSLPRLARAHREASLQGVTSTVITQMWRARSEAMTSGQSTALVFDRRRDGGWHCEIVQDGDGDGVRRSDREAGIDVTIGRRLDMDSDHVGFGILQGVAVPNPNGSGPLGGDLNDPIRAGASDTLTFTADGTATSATLYLTDQRSMMRAIRVFGVTGRLRTLAWQVGWERWRIARR